MSEKDIAALKALLAASERILVFTGAGISVDSGIPDFRTPGGIWSRLDPLTLNRDAVLGPPARRRAFWATLLGLVDSLGHPRPNAGHAAVAELERRGKVVAVITQNIDGLHQAAGSQDVVELHGNLNETVCADCGARGALPATVERLRRGETDPRCHSCGGRLRPDFVLFGDPLPAPALSRVWSLAHRCDVCLVLGSSLVVHPAADIPAEARRAGARLAIVTASATPLDGAADLRVRSPLAHSFVPAVAALA